MKKLSFLLPIFLYAQVIDTVIPLFDEPREQLLYIPQGNKLYINFDQTRRFCVLDCSTNTVRKIIELPSGYPTAAYGVWNYRRNKIYYVFNSRPESIAVIDGHNDSIIIWIEYDANWPPCYNSINDKVYATNGFSLAVIDCETDSIIKIIQQPHYLSSFVVWDSIGNKVYCGGGIDSDLVTVINCNNDSVIAVISTQISPPSAAVFNFQRRKVYIGSEFGDRGVVIDAITDTLIKSFSPITYNWIVPIVYNNLEDKVYWPSDNSINIIECSRDSIIKNLIAPHFIWGICLANWSNRLYIVSDSFAGQEYTNILRLFDCRNDSLISQIRFGKLMITITSNPLEHKIYIADHRDSSLYVIRDEILGIEERSALYAERFTQEIYPNPAGSYLAVRLPLSDDRQAIKIFDVSGKMIKEVGKVTSTQEHKGELIISLKGINPGIYFLRFGTETKKFLVVK